MMATKRKAMQSIFAALFAICTICTLAAKPAVAIADDALEQARRQLAARELSAVGQRWICSEEVEIRRLLEQLDGLNARYHKQRDAVDLLVEANKQWGAKLDAAQAKLNRMLAARENAALSSAARRRFDRQIEDSKRRVENLREKFRDANQFGQTPEIRQEVMRLANLRNELTLAAITIRRNTEALPTTYGQLAADGDLARQIARFGPASRLGPLGDYQEELRRLAQIEPAINSLDVAIYREENRFCVPAILNERIPAMLSLRESTGPTLLPDSLIQSAEIAIPADAKRYELRISDRRTLIARETAIETLRIGPAIYRNVTALAMPPEGEDIGARLSKDVAAQRPFVVDGLQLRLTLDP